MKLAAEQLQALKIISVPFLIILIVVAVFAICKINMEFFSVTGLILVFGLVTAYISSFFYGRNKKKKLQLFFPKKCQK